MSFLLIYNSVGFYVKSTIGPKWLQIRPCPLSSKYKTGTKFIWWGVSSCTTNIEVLKSKQFLGKHGQRTLFSIECSDGKCIATHSYFKEKEKEIILMPGSYFDFKRQKSISITFNNESKLIRSINCHRSINKNNLSRIQFENKSFFPNR